MPVDEAWEAAFWAATERSARTERPDAAAAVLQALLVREPTHACWRHPAVKALWRSLLAEVESTSAAQRHVIAAARIFISLARATHIFLYDSPSHAILSHHQNFFHAELTRDCPPSPSLHERMRSALASPPSPAVTGLHRAVSLDLLALGVPHTNEFLCPGARIIIS